MRPTIDKPVTLRQDTWDYLREQLGEEVSANDIAKHPAKYAHMAKLIDHPELLQNTIVALEGDVEYKITAEAAQAIKTAMNSSSCAASTVKTRASLVPKSLRPSKTTANSIKWKGRLDNSRRPVPNRLLSRQESAD
jgi:hypothetical protein